MSEIYRLDPNPDRMADPAWEATNLAEACWVLAQSAGQARMFVELATLRHVERGEGQGIRSSPWRDPSLTSCTPDDPDILIPEGVVVSVGGLTYS